MKFKYSIKGLTVELSDLTDWLTNLSESQRLLLWGAVGSLGYLILCCLYCLCSYMSAYEPKLDNVQIFKE
jgi:hypothetical protein